MSVDHDTELKLQNFLPFRLSVLSNAVSKAVAEHYQEQFGISIWQWRVMAVLGETPGLSASDIAKRTQMDKVAVSRAVSSLIELGHLRREAVQDDGRRSRLQLTEEGDGVYRRIAPAALAFENRLTAGIDDNEMAAFARVMEQLASRVAPKDGLW